MSAVSRSLLLLALCVTGMVRAKAEVASGNLIEVVLSLRKEVTEMARKNEEQDRKIAQQEKQISMLQQKSVQQENDGTDLKKKIVELENDMLTLKKKDAEQVNDVKELKKTVVNNEHSVTELKNRTNELEKDVEELKGNTGEQESETTRQRELIHDQNDDNHTIRERQAPERVAFSLYLSHDQQHTTVGEKIRFDAILLNEGNGYSIHTAAFTAPTKGIYLFAYSIGKWRVGEAFIHLMKNGNVINGAAVDVKVNSADEHASNVALVELDVGDVVYVEEYYTSDVLIYGNTVSRWTTFSGVLLI